MKKQGVGLLAVLSVVVALGAAAPARAGGPTLVVAPARYSVLQVGFDLVQRYGVTLVSYRGEAATEKPLLHVWTGQEWKFIALPDFQSGAFLDQKPAQTVVIGDARMVPAVFAPMAAWAGRQVSIPSLFTDEILNQASKALRFSRGDWDWFAARYNLKLDDTNAALRSDSWYGHTYDKPIHIQFKRPSRAPDASVEPAPAPVMDEAKKDAVEMAPLQDSTPPADPSKAEPARPADEPVSDLSLRLAPAPAETNAAVGPTN
ncbi:MAG: hypothetical protein NTV49_12050 [Kiritimatiellaeota bacterium]|nr:hypothetical protein [Kiritimatiellota bacterium]